MRVHYAHSYLASPPHQVTVDLIGLGGTGSQVLTNLARINATLLTLGHPGLHVRCWDHDRVSEANLGRQLFSASDLGHPKATVLVTRINRYFGFGWEAIPDYYKGGHGSNIMITCVDTAYARVVIADQLATLARERDSDPVRQVMYWMDFGNSEKTGQVILGTLQPIRQPVLKGKEKNVQTVTSLPVVTKVFNLKKVKDTDEGPSCSLAEAIRKQDLFINSCLAQLGCALIWKLFREGSINYHGVFLNLKTMTSNPIKI